MSMFRPDASVASPAHLPDGMADSSPAAPTQLLDDPQEWLAFGRPCTPTGSPLPAHALEAVQACPEANEVGDRAEAILRGVDALQPGDALLIAGKGHETGQVIKGDVYPFDDVEQASIAVAALDGMI